MEFVFYQLSLSLCVCVCVFTAVCVFFFVFFFEKCLNPPRAMLVPWLGYLWWLRRSASSQELEPACPLSAQAGLILAANSPLKFPQMVTKSPQLVGQTGETSSPHPGLAIKCQLS